MKSLKSKVSLLGIFIVAIVLLILYLLSMRGHFHLPVTLFWVSHVALLSTMVYQILKIDLSSSYVKVVLLEIVIICVVFHLIYQIPYYGLRGTDSYGDMNCAKGILYSGFVMGDPQYINKYSPFPIMHIFGVITSSIAGIDLFSVVKWFPSLFGIAFILLLYLLMQSIYKKEKISLLSALLFVYLGHHMLISSLFIRETIALVLAVCCLYLYFSAKHSPHPITNYSLSIVLLVVTIFAHHLTSFMLLLFLLIHFIVTRASEVPSLRRAYFGYNIHGKKVTATYLLIGFTTLFAYWAYVATLPFYILVSLVKSVFAPTQWGTQSYSSIADISATSIQTLRGNIIFYGFFFFHIIFAVILLYNFLPRVKKHRVETFSSTLFLFLCGIMGFLSLYVIAAAAFPDRYLMFGWLFGFAPLVAIILKAKSKWLRKIGIFLLIAFMLLNIYMIETTVWDVTGADTVVAPSEEDYILANTFNFSNGTILAPQNASMAIYDVHNNLGTYITASGLNLTEFDWIVIPKEMLNSELRTETQEMLKLLVTEGHSNYAKIYESNKYLVFKQR